MSKNFKQVELLDLYEVLFGNFHKYDKN